MVINITPWDLKTDGTLVEIKSNDSAKMKFLEPFGRRFKWPTKDDIVDINKKAVISQIEITYNATGRLWTVHNVDKIEEQFTNCFFLERKM